MKFAVSVIVYFGDEFLFLERVDNTFVPPCGKLEKDESPREGAIRELFEETGMVASQRDLLLLDYWNNNDKFSFTFIFNSHSKKVTISTEHISYMWVRDLENFQPKTDYNLQKWQSFKRLNEFYRKEII